MSSPVSPLNAFVQHIDPKTGRFTQEGFNYFSNLANVVNEQANTAASQAETIAILQANIAALQKGQTTT